MKEIEELPLKIKCHCGSDAHKYRSRSFINQNGNKVSRLFYRCENCWSRTPFDYIPELDGPINL